MAAAVLLFFSLSPFFFRSTEGGSWCGTRSGLRDPEGATGLVAGLEPIWTTFEEEPGTGPGKHKQTVRRVREEGGFTFLLKTAEDQGLRQPVGHGVDSRFGKSRHSYFSRGIQGTSRMRLDLDPTRNVQKHKGPNIEVR